jgi:hypothetical protein
LGVGEGPRGLQKQKAKLVIAKLDRLSRNLAFIATLMDSGVEFVAVDNSHAHPKIKFSSRYDLTLLMRNPAEIFYPRRVRFPQRTSASFRPHS